MSTATRRPVHPRRRAVRRILAAAIVLASLAYQAIPADAVSTPGTSVNGEPIQFLPAPNDVPYCDGTEYFLTWDKLVDIYDASGNFDVEPTYDQDNDMDPANDTGFQRVQTDYLRTSPLPSTDGIVGTLTVPSADPQTWPGYWPPYYEDGLGFTGPGAFPDSTGYSRATIALSEPLFYSSWVTVDNDQTNEGFRIQPTWGGSSSEVLLVSPDAAYTMGITNTSDFNFYLNVVRSTTGDQLIGRVQADLFGPVTEIALEHVGGGSNGLAVGSGCPSIGVAKSASTPVWDAATQSYTVTYTISVTNNLPSTATLATLIDDAIASSGQSSLSAYPTGIDLTGVSLDDPLDLTGMTHVVIDGVSSTGTLAVNSSYDGTADTELIGAGQSLAPETTETITVDARYFPDLQPDAGCPQRTLQNQAIGSAVADGVAVSDKSDDGTDPSPSSVNASGTGTEDPTVITFPAIAGCGSVNVTKTTSTPSITPQSDGAFDVAYEITVANTGAVDLMTVPTDDLSAAFGSAADISGVSLVSTGPCAGVENPAWGLADTALVSAPVLLEADPAESCVFSATLTVNPGPTVRYDSSYTNTAESVAGVVSYDGSGTAVTGANQVTDSAAVAVDVARYTISGLVAEDLNGDNSGDGPLTGIVIRLLDGSGVEVFTTTTDTDGQYSFAGLPPGSYTVREVDPVGYDSLDDADGGTDNRIAVTVVASDVTDRDFLDSPPDVLDDQSLGNTLGATVSLDVLANDHSSVTADSINLVDPSTGYPASKVTIADQGTWRLSGETVTFTPLNGFDGNPTPIVYVAGNDAGADQRAAVIVTYLPEAADDSDLDNQWGDKVTVDPPANDRGRLDPTSVRIVDPATGNPVTKLTVDGEGTWTVNQTSATISFTPDSAMSDDPSPIDYRISHVDCADGGVKTGITSTYSTCATVDATVTVTYLVSSEADVDEGNVPGTPVTVDPLANDRGAMDPTTVRLIDPVTGETSTMVVVVGEGTWTVDTELGFITFTPEAGFTGNPAPIEYEVTPVNGSTPTRSTVTVTYDPPTGTTSTNDGSTDTGPADTVPADTGSGAAGSGGTGGSLPTTGAATGRTALVGLMLVLIGASILLVRRRRLVV